ncbi:MAG: aminotransferase class V-fold PLP-dependent enzyme [Phycisphaeraceae bacterium]|nr:aminotransferase class V-fold PLP-dependent enzyme [Phycisphaeraceae bacterium]
MESRGTRRAFLGQTFGAAGALGLAGLASRAAGTELGAAWAEELASFGGTPQEIAANEDYWFQVQQAFSVDRSVVNFNNGGICPSPNIVQDAMRRLLEYTNRHQTSSALWGVLQPQMEGVRERVARQWGVDKEEVAFTRNASESLQICQMGMDLEPGDEVLTTTLDYPRMVNTFRQRERRDGIKLVQFKLPIPLEDEDDAVRLFESHITDRTRIILMCHIINVTGQVLPVRKICAMARRRGIPVIVDGAHSFAHLDYTLGELDCDYYGVSLHKWLFAPHGTGLLYVRREKIKGLWPLMAATAAQDEDIRKFEEFGTRPMANCVAIGEALTFHQGIGPARKEARMRYLRDRWARRLLAHPSGRVRMHTSLDPRFSCGLGTFQIEGVDSGKLRDVLWDRHRIFVIALKHEEFEGIRVTPSVHSTIEEVDRFSEAIERVLEKGLPE